MFEGAYFCCTWDKKLQESYQDNEEKKKLNWKDFGWREKFEGEGPLVNDHLNMML